MHIGVVVVASVAQIVGGRQLRAPVTTYVEEEERVDDRQLGIALVALHVVVERLAVVGVDVFDALPREYAVVVEVEREISGEQQTEDIRHAKKYLGDIIDEVYGGKEQC